MSSGRRRGVLLQPLRDILQSPQDGLLLVMLLLGAPLTAFAGSHTDPASGPRPNDFFKANTLIQTAPEARFLAIMAVGATVVIISGGVDLSLGSRRRGPVGDRPRTVGKGAAGGLLV